MRGITKITVVDGVQSFLDAPAEENLKSLDEPLSEFVKGKVDFPQIGFEKGTTERGVSKVSKSC